MTILAGSKYEISKNIQPNFNSAEYLTVLRQGDSSVQFTLGEGKGHGSMPLDHMKLLLKKNELRYIPTKQTFLKEENGKAQIS
ncbi:hypothetical protein [Halalkalibacter okhensis]|uniref:Uncharacterized protein n=1 Tax=Halalkalibacter okhensis TaxID=333138 RepID=A0A0B0IFW9_9BACI|nr:hypothetical protein [Halalkalibacter okhensis]KHF40200.1 hypothetical protein LQ50_10680 [Halalkalibacter okhensis]